MNKVCLNERDVLDEVLRSLQPQGRILCQLELSGPWAFRMPDTGLARFHVVEKGSCWLQTQDGAPVALGAGDLVIVLYDHHLSNSAKSRSSASLETFIERLKQFTRIGFRKPGATPTTHLLCGSFQLTRGVGHLLLNVLPPVLHVKSRSGGRSVEWLDLTLRFLNAEIAQLGMGSETVVSRLTDLIFIQAVRAWVGEEPEGAGARLGALRDRHIGSALRLMHREPGRAWRVSTLARAVGVSRATLARRFTLLVGEPPLTYLGRSRMRLAADLMRSEDLTLGEIAARVGYQSEAALSRMFSRVMGLPPGAYRRAYRRSARDINS
jgi:AraC-like DNA-binding protein